MKVDQQGNIFCTGPGGIWIIEPGGSCLGRIKLPKFLPTLPGTRGIGPHYMSLPERAFIRLQNSNPTLIILKNLLRGGDIGMFEYFDSHNYAWNQTLQIALAGPGISTK